MNRKRTPDKPNPYRSRIGRVRYGFMVKSTTLDELRRLATDLEMSYGEFIEEAIEEKITKIKQR